MISNTNEKIYTLLNQVGIIKPNTCNMFTTTTI